MKRSKLAGIISVIILLGVIFIPALIKSISDYIHFHEKIGTCIFSDISECEKFKEYDGINIKKYDTSEKDKKLKGVDYEKFYAAKISCSEFEFEIFAYEFNDIGSAQTYFENVTGKEVSANTEFSSSFGPLSGRRIVIDGKNAYVIYCSSIDEKAVLNFLYKTFTVNLDF